ncbi:class D beta-lactamase [Lacibacterium aquatile]|uniref:Beta-lactamase n=1 Tax=Lacibacterium aquatile TaxID=1168082 RepID=A0ABW5DX00_9PROT
MSFWLKTALFALGLSFTVSAAAKPDVECTLIVDASTGEQLVRQGACDQRFSPFSTFKLPLALMGYDAGILGDAQTPNWPYRAEYGGTTKDKQSTDPTRWQHESILWYSREVTRRLGTERFAAYVTQMGYGNRDVSGDAGKKNGLTHAWLRSSLAISPDEQVAFLRRIDSRALGLSDRAYSLSVAILPTFQAGDWQVRGKTGTGWYREPSGKVRSDRPQGWFIGWAERNGRRITFARFERGLEPRDGMGPKVRDDFLKALPTLMR